MKFNKHIYHDLLFEHKAYGFIEAEIYFENKHVYREMSLGMCYRLKCQY